MAALGRSGDLADLEMLYPGSGIIRGAVPGHLMYERDLTVGISLDQSVIVFLLS